MSTISQKSPGVNETEMTTHKDYEHRVFTTEAERIALAAAKLAANDVMNETLALFGVSRGNQASVDEFRADLGFIRVIRTGSVKAGVRFGLTIVTILATGFAYGVWSWVKAAAISAGHGH